MFNRMNNYYSKYVMLNNVNFGPIGDESQKINSKINNYSKMLRLYWLFSKDSLIFIFVFFNI